MLAALKNVWKKVRKKHEDNLHLFVSLTCAGGTIVTALVAVYGVFRSLPILSVLLWAFGTFAAIEVLVLSRYWWKKRWVHLSVIGAVTVFIIGLSYAVYSSLPPSVIITPQMGR